MKLSKSLQKLFVCSVALASIASLGVSASNMNANASRRHHHIVRVIKRHHHKVHHYRKRSHKRHKTLNFRQLQKHWNKQPVTYYYDDSTNSKKFQDILQGIREGFINPKTINKELKSTVSSMNTVTNREVDILEAEIESGSEWHFPKSTMYLMKYNMTNSQATQIANCAKANHKPYYEHIFGNLKQSGYQYKLPEQHKQVNHNHKSHKHYQSHKGYKSYKHRKDYSNEHGVDDPTKGHRHHTDFRHDPFHGAHLSDKIIHHYTYGSRMKFGHHKGHFFVG